MFGIELIFTAAIVMTQGKLCEFKGKNIARFHSSSFGFGHFEQT
jgi:hypothetical protein